MSEIKSHYRNCNICEAMCGLDISYQNGQIIAIKGDQLDPFSQGYNCPKALALEDFYTDKDRLKTPIKRTAEGWQAISWDDAFSEIVDKFKHIQQQHGKNALAVYLGNPNAHSLGNALFLKPFMKSLGTLNRFSSASADQLPHHVAANFMFGAGMLIPVSDIDRTDFMLIIGANPVVSNGSMMTAPNVIGRLKAIQKRGGKVVVVDPRKTRTAKIADQHVFIRPEKDAFLLLALIHCVFAHNKVNIRHLSDKVDGLGDIENLVRDYSPQVVSPLVGIEVEVIETLSAQMLAADSAVCYSRMGASTQSFGGICLWLTNVLNIITGNFDRAGGAMFPQPAFDLLRNHQAGHKSSFGQHQSRVRKLPFFNGEFPVAALAEEIQTPGEGQIRSIITIAGNPVLSAPSGHKLAEAFSELEYMVSIDIYLNETTQYADIILPGTTGVENSHFDIFFNSFSVRNTVKYSAPLFEKHSEQRGDWQILKEIAARMLNVPADDPMQQITPEMILDMELKKGPYGKQGMSLQTLIDNPHGIDIGPLMPCLSERIKTANGNIDLFPQVYQDDLPRLQAFMTQTTRDNQYPFDLISRRLVKSHNTWTQNSERLIKGKNPCTLEMHPQDAQKLGAHTGQQVIVSSAVGEIKIDIVITDDVQPGVVTMPQGWGHNQPDTKMSVAATQPGVSINDLTDAKRVDMLTGNAAFNGTPVAIKLA
ncbi:molybdopterin-dependent oxidoreductase [Shewanella inventionis]|uniref:Dehydrogenase n=1 Tax=Shewanella inventionis TaxID=1738770 RepID=A0ABQ1JGC9_9GAMM|nr:molybdopterin-dependent oxidoreductase [Shewanella inventionis]MCL1158384.1 molybdopterin-dependent oxidoreductase [Shewanella inventionis]UAL41739.1 molybdopterin-dependent oxidoreductase [Shewanella inventionis]GGB68358.1 dehydrogenase [Shewanella inventionis]